MSDLLRDHVVEILRRDLKLGNDYPVGDDMPLFNSDADLDSLDLLLMVSSLEREFGFKIPSDAMGETVFRSVQTLTDYVRSNQNANRSNGESATSQARSPLDRLPHTDPFRFVSRLNQLKPGDTAEGTWDVTGTEAFFTGHFPGRPIVPGVLIAEALAQLSGLISPPESTTGQGKLVHVDVRFESTVAPPATIQLHSRLVRKVVSLQQFEVSANVSRSIVARGTIALQLTAS